MTNYWTKNFTLRIYKKRNKANQDWKKKRKEILKVRADMTLYSGLMTVFQEENKKS